MTLRFKIKPIIRYFIVLSILLLFSCEALARPPEKSMTVDNGQIKYYEIGSGKPILLIHGLFANKEQWLQFVEKLIEINPKITQQFQFIIPDLPGYGHSTGYPVKAYNLDGDDSKAESLNQVSIVHHFIQQLHLNFPIRIAGNSMGGMIMTLYAVHYPKEVRNLAYIGSPLGVADFTPKFINTGFRQGYNPFIPTTAEQFKNELYLLLVNYQAIMPSDERIEKKIIPFEEKNFIMFTAAFNMVNANKKYRDYLKSPRPITQPILVLWGDKDYIFGGTQYARKLCHNLNKSKNCAWHSIPNAGHVLMLEDAKTLLVAAKYYQRFLGHSSAKQSTRGDATSGQVVHKIYN
jgi:abhydrolase domain-containing protein 6